MRRVIGFAMVLSIVVCTAIGALDFTVNYAEGSVETNADGGWHAVFAGETVSGSDQIRIGPGAFVELRGDSGVVRLSRPGTFAVRDLSHLEESATELDTAVGSLLRALVFKREIRETTTAGARASDAASEPEVEWAGGMSAWDLMAKGIEYLAAGDPEEAYFEFEEAYLWAEPDEQSRIGYLYALTASQIGERDLAREILAEIPLSDDEYWYVDAQLLRAELLLESGDAPGAVAAAETAEAILTARTATSPARLQMVQFLLGEALTLANRTGEAHTAYARAVETAPDTALAEVARDRSASP